MSDDAGHPGRSGASGGGDSPLRPLASIVRGEARRAESEERIRPDPARLADGWAYRFVIERSRVGDLLALYGESGFEVAIDPVAPERLQDECSDCRLALHLDYVQVYTRRRGHAEFPDST